MCCKLIYMEVGNTFYANNRNEWRAWLAANFDKEKEIWLISPSKDSGNARVEYNDAVEEALSFGWIDSTVKPYDDQSSAQRYTPRNPRSTYSQANIERLKWLAREGKLHPSVLPVVDRALKTKFVFPPDIIQALKSNKKAWQNYRKFSPSYQRIRIAYIDGARKRPQEFKKRLENFIVKTAQNKIIGYGGIDKYY